MRLTRLRALLGQNDGSWKQGRPSKPVLRLTAAMRMNADTQFKELTPAQNVRQPLSKSAISTSIDARTRMKGCINARSAAPPSPDNTAATGTSGHSILAVISAVPSFLIGTP
ncbi:hypothetical protein HPB49_008922 [Dermacentor silvarum]|uniref:Uncharacterized protein n=1 Tax=Dermacentor silvarum TaxID=543639 RepID=A0ACB8D3Z5_DERSI|nr:hypothetical protein HPB49_008922 [Dermacentor silvarum]